MNHFLTSESLVLLVNLEYYIAGSPQSISLRGVFVWGKVTIDRKLTSESQRADQRLPGCDLPLATNQHSAPSSHAWMKSVPTLAKPKMMQLAASSLMGTPLTILNIHSFLQLLNTVVAVFAICKCTEVVRTDGMTPLKPCSDTQPSS